MNIWIILLSFIIKYLAISPLQSALPDPRWLAERRMQRQQPSQWEHSNTAVWPIRGAPEQPLGCQTKPRHAADISAHVVWRMIYWPMRGLECEPMNQSETRNAAVVVPGWCCRDLCMQSLSRLQMAVTSDRAEGPDSDTEKWQGNISDKMHQFRAQHEINQQPLNSPHAAERPRQGIKPRDFFLD